MPEDREPRECNVSGEVQREAKEGLDQLAEAEARKLDEQLREDANAAMYQDGTREAGSPKPKLTPPDHMGFTTAAHTPERSAEARARRAQEAPCPECEAIGGIHSNSCPVMGGTVPVFQPKRKPGIEYEDLDAIFVYHAPDQTDVVKYAEVREAAHLFAQAILTYAPRSADQTVAIRKVREALMTANAAIALKGRF